MLVCVLVCAGVCAHVCVMHPPSTEEHAGLREQAKQIAKSMNLSVVRLCFQAFLPDEAGRFTIPVEPVFSQKVYDCSKSVVSSMCVFIFTRCARPCTVNPGVKLLKYFCSRKMLWELFD